MYTYHFILDGLCVYKTKMHFAPESLLGKEIKIPYLLERYRVEGFTINGYREYNLFLAEISIQSPTH